MLQRWGMGFAIMAVVLGENGQNHLRAIGGRLFGVHRGDAVICRRSLLVLFSRLVHCDALCWMSFGPGL